MKIHISENIIKKVESRVENYFIQQVSQKALYFCIFFFFFILRIFRVILNFEIYFHKCVKVHSLIIRNETSFSRRPKASKYEGRLLI